MDDINNTPHAGKGRNVARTVWASIEYVSYRFAEAIGENLSVMRKELDLFLGVALLLLGLFNWTSGKYCDGNTSDYLSCTRPTVYYYYGGVEIALIVLGAWLIIAWYIKNRRSK